MIMIRQAVYEDIPRIMQFIDEHWKRGHILARDRAFFEWQYMDGDKVNVFLGIDDASGTIYGIHCVIVYSQCPNPDISGSIWKTIKSNNPVLGMELSSYAYEQLHARYSCSAGLSKKAIRIWKMLDMNPVSMDHYYRLTDREEYQIAKVESKRIPEVEETGYEIVAIDSIEEMKHIISERELANHIMSKDYAYIQKRYFDHPIYQYDMWKILDPNGISHSILITREEAVQNRKVCKIIDFYGKLSDLGQITPALDQLMKEREYEFVDVYSFGVPPELYEQAGFMRCETDSENIIPNYFHPFEQKNVDLDLINPMIEGLRLFRGDGDQDRPC